MRSCASCLRHREHDVFACHEGKFSEKIRGDHRFPNYKTFRDIGHDVECAIEGEECFRQDESAVGTVIERAFKPLRRVGLQRIVHETHHESCKSACAFAPHRIAFVGHRARSNLLLLERFFDFLAVGEQAKIGGALVDRGCSDRKRADDLCIDEACVCLPAHAEHLAAWPTEFVGEDDFELLDLRSIAIEEA